jgi:hypothetical protein
MVSGGGFFDVCGRRDQPAGVIIVPGVFAAPLPSPLRNAPTVSACWHETLAASICRIFPMRGGAEKLARMASLTVRAVFPERGRSRGAWVLTLILPPWTAKLAFQPGLMAPSSPRGSARAEHPGWYSWLPTNIALAWPGERESDDHAVLLAPRYGIFAATPRASGPGVWSIGISQDGCASLGNTRVANVPGDLASRPRGGACRGTGSTLFHP